MPLPAAQPRKKRYEPLWDRVDSNRLRLAAYVVVFVALSVLVIDLLVAVAAVLVWAVITAFGGLDVGSLTHFLLEGGPNPTGVFINTSLIAALSALTWALVAIVRSERWVLARLGATFVPKGELYETKMMLKDMAIAAGEDIAPALYLLDTPNVNAFIVDSPWRRAAVGVTQGLVDKLALEEQRAVFANLVARLRAGDTLTATGLTALMMPVHAWRDWSLKRQEHTERPEKGMMFDPETGQTVEYYIPDLRVLLFFPFILFGFALAILGEIIAAGHRRAQLRTAETADAEAMLLLKDPATMLNTLEQCIRFNNYIPVSDETFGQLFYCWPGSSTDDEDDPEWMRVARLREVLGVEGEGWAMERISEIEFTDDGPFAPPPPRLGA